MAVAELLLLVLTLLLSVYIWQKWHYNYWQRQNVKYVPPFPLLGNLKGLFSMKHTISTCLWQLYNTPDCAREPAVGIYMVLRPALLIRDLDLVKRIMIKDFTLFTNRVMRADPHHDPLGSNNIFFVRNPEWRELRTKLSPVFTSGKVKQMYPLIVEIGEELEANLASIPDATVIDVKQWCARLTVDMIGTIAFGIKANSLKDPTSEFYTRSRDIFALTIRRAFDFTFTFVMPSMASLLRVQLFTKDTAEFLRKSMRYVLAEREKSGNIRNDLIDTLIGLKKAALADPTKTNPARNLDYLVAQAALFQTAGFETSSSTLTFTLHELAFHQDIQARLRAEINAAFEAGQGAISYEQINTLPYLGQVVDETLRKYPIVGFLERECSPLDGSSGYSLQPQSDFFIPAGMGIYVSVLGLHRDPQYWPEPDKFDPERFAPENRDNVKWDAYMPFGIGPRNCIGMRIGLLQTKLGLVHFLKNHRVSPSAYASKTITFDPKSVVLANKGGVHLKLERVSS